MVRADLSEAVEAAQVRQVRFEIPDGTTIRPRGAVAAAEFGAALLAGHRIAGSVDRARVYRSFAADSTVVEVDIVKETGDGS